MSETIKAEGKCLCGSVSLIAHTLSNKVGACHCSMCRTLCTGPYMAVDCGTNVEISNTQSLGIYSSSDWAERGFCKTCGSQIFYRLKDTGQHIVSVSIFPEEIEFDFDHQVFIDEKPNYYCFSNETENMTGAELFAKFGATLSE